MALSNFTGATKNWLGGNGQGNVEDFSKLHGVGMNGTQYGTNFNKNDPNSAPAKWGSGAVSSAVAGNAAGAPKRWMGPTLGAEGIDRNANTAAGAMPTYGTQSGPTYDEDRYLSRASGTDPAWEYGVGRATDAINKQYAARGGYNSSGAMNSLDDMFANAVSQREGQLDALAHNATTSHQNALDSMFRTGTGLANGQSGTAFSYANGAGGAMNQNMISQIDLALSKAGVDQKTRQAEMDTLMKLFGAGATALG